jgi:hypothetical protein
VVHDLSTARVKFRMPCLILRTEQREALFRSIAIFENSAVVGRMGEKE